MCERTNPLFLVIVRYLFEMDVSLLKKHRGIRITSVMPQLPEILAGRRLFWASRN